MAVYGNQNFTSFTAVNLKGTTAIRFAADVAGNESTLSVRPSLDAARAWSFPDKSGTFPIMGTFRVQIPALTTNWFSTIVTVSGIRAEDALIVQFNGPGVTGTTYGFASSTGYIMSQVIPGNGNITIQLNNIGNSTGYLDLTASYLAMR